MLDNPYIIQYCDSFIDDEQLNIVMVRTATKNSQNHAQNGAKNARENGRVAPVFRAGARMTRASFSADSSRFSKSILRRI